MCRGLGRAGASGNVRGTIVLHGPYTHSGTIAGAAFKQIVPGQYKRVIVLGTAHGSKFRGCSIPSVQLYRTPLGDIPLDGVAIRALSRSSLIEVRSVHYRQSPERHLLHEKEYSIEVVLPFLQVRLGDFALIPILVGQFEDYGGKMDLNGIEAVADILRPYVDEHTLLVVSSDFTHFGNNFSYRPFNDNIIENIEALDKAAFDLILARNYKGFNAYLEQTQNTICGKEAILLFLKLLPKNAKGTLLAYAPSAKTTGNTDKSISYAALSFNDPTRPVEVTSAPQKEAPTSPQATSGAATPPDRKNPKTKEQP